MKKDNSTTHAIFGLVLMIAIIVGFVLMIVWLNRQELNFLLGLVVGLIPTFITIYQRKKERDEDYRNWLMQNKEACAIEIMNTIFDLAFEKSNLSEHKQKKWIEKRIKQLLPAMVVWGSSDLIKQWEKIASMSHGGDGVELIKQGELLIRTVRKDLNHNDSDLKPGALWAMMIKSDEKQQAYDACKGETYN